MLTKIWHILFGPAPEKAVEVRADEEVVRRELEASAPAPELQKLAAARGAKLVHVQGTFIGTKKDYDLPGTLIPDLELICVTLELTEGTTLYLKGRGDGEGLETTNASYSDSESFESRDLDDLEPFANVIGTRLRELTLLSTRGNPRHAGIRLQFEEGELVFLNLWDEIEVYDGLVPDVLQPEDERGRPYIQVYEYPYAGAG